MKRKVWKFNIKIGVTLFVAMVVYYNTVRAVVENITWIHEFGLGVLAGGAGIFLLFGSIFPYVGTLADRYVHTDEMRRNIREHPIGKYVLIYDLWGENDG